ncbi:MAG: peptidase and in kexin sedolisin [Paenibacillaceae bacterium]|jgi:hypothetical protein|nr:peptidase and in kexin sedolisin [Paenibacillaceae bacterium]
MKRKLIVWMMIMALMISACPIAALASENEPVLYQQFNESFDNGLMAWKINNGAARITDAGRLELQNTTGTNDVTIIGSGAVWQDQTLQLTFNRKNAQGSNFTSITLRHGSPNNLMLLFRDNSISYKLGTMPAEAQLSAYKIDRNTDYDLKIVAKGTEANVQIKKSAETAYQSVGTIRNIPAGKGTLKLYTYQAAAEFDNIVIFNDPTSGLFLKHKVLTASPGGTINLELLNTTAQPLVWTSSDPATVTVSAYGEAAVLKKGNAAITVSTADGALSDTCQIIGVSLLTSIAFSPAALTLEEGESTNLAIVYTPSSADNKTLIWSVADSSIAELVGQASKARGIKAKNAGVTMIRAVTPNGAIMAERLVTVTEKAVPTPTSASFKAEGAPNPIPFGIYGMHYTLVNRINSWTNYNPPNIMDSMRDLKIQSLRGPDGTPSNYFMAKEGVTMSTQDPRYAGFYGTKSAGLDSYSTIKPGYSPLTPADIYYAPNELQIPYLYCVNVSSQSAAEILSILDDIKQVTDSPVNLELGNELYDTYGMMPFVTVDDYVAKVRQIYTAVKERYPDTKIGIVILTKSMEQRIISDPNNQPYEGMEVDWGSTFLGRIFNWNTTVAQNAAYYDAVIPHDYTNLPSVNGLTADDVMSHLSTYTKETYEGFVEQAAQFPGKEMWVSEWGAIPEILFSESDAGEKARMQLMRTPGFAIHYMERLLTMIQTGVIQYSSYHTLVDGQGFGIQSGNKFPAYYTFKGMGQLLSENSHYYPVKLTEGVVNHNKLRFTNETVYHDVEEVGVWGFGSEAGITQAVFINRTNHPVTVELEEAQLKPVWTYGNGDDPIPDLAVAPFATFRDFPVVNPEPIISQGEYAESMVIAPYTAVIADIALNP